MLHMQVLEIKYAKTYITFHPPKSYRVGSGWEDIIIKVQKVVIYCVFSVTGHV